MCYRESGFDATAVTRQRRLELQILVDASQLDSGAMIVEVREGQARNRAKLIMRTRMLMMMTRMLMILKR